MRFSKPHVALFLTLAAIVGLAGGAQAQSARDREEKAQSKPSRSESKDDRRDNRNDDRDAISVLPVIIGGSGGGGGGGSVSYPAVPRYGGERFGNNPRIAFVSDRSGIPAACVMWENGSVRQTITRAGEAVHDVAFSPYRGRVACTVSAPGGAAGQIVLMNANGRKAKRLDADSHAQGLAWSPDDNWIVYSSDRSGNSELYAASADGKTIRRLTEHPARDTDPTISGDGEWVYFASDRDGKSAIYRLRWDGTGTVERVTPATAPPASQPTCAPWGNNVAYVGQDPDESQKSNLYLIDVGTKKVSQLTVNAGRNVNPTFSPDGARIAFSSNRNGTFALWVLPTQGGEARQLTFGPGNDTHPSWW